MTVKNDTMRTVTIDEIVSSAQINLGLNSDADRTVMYEWVSEANRAIGLGHTNQLQEIIDIKDFTFPAPCNMIKPLQIRLLGDSTDIGGQGIIVPFYDEEAFLRKTGDKKTQGGAIIIQLQGNTFVLSNNVNANRFDKAEIKFYGIPLDDNGYPLVDEYNKRTIVQYIEYMYIKRERRRERHNGTPIPQGEVESEYNKYLRLKAEAISHKKMPDKLRMDDINRKWNTLLPNQKRKTSNTSSTLFGGGFFLT